jgi:hypothetical protein
MIVPDVLLMKKNEKFFIECKTNYSDDKKSNFGIEKIYWDNYCNFYNTYYPKMQDQEIAENETLIAFIDVYDDCAVIYLATFSLLRNIQEVNKRYNKEFVIFNRHTVDDYSEKIYIKLDYNEERGIIRTVYNNDLFNTKRNIKIFSLDDFKE